MVAPPSSKAEYIVTDTGNIVSRKAAIFGSQNIILAGKTIITNGVLLRGDLRRAGTAAAVVLGLGKYSVIREGTIVRPPYKTYKGVFSYYPMKIGNYVSIGDGCIIEAASIGDGVVIGKNCIISRFVIIKDCAEILEGTVLAPGTVVPSMAVFGGSPGKYQYDLPESAPEMMETRAREFYLDFKATV